MATVKQRGPYQWRAQVRRKGYKPVSKTFESKREAEAWAATIESEMVRSVFVDRSLSEKTTFEEVIKGYIKDVAPAHKGGDAEISRLQRFLREEDALAARAMSTLKTSDFEDFRDHRLAGSKDKDQRPVSPGTVKRELNLLHSVIETVRKKYGMVENPISDVRRPRVSDSRDVRLAEGEEEALLKALDASRNPWIKPAVILALETAMRRGELLALRWQYVDTKDRVAHLPETKNGESRDVPLSKRAVKILEALPRSVDGRVLQTTAEGLKNAFERARKRAGMEHFNFHDLRHEATSRLFERGWEIQEVAHVTGHKDWQSLKRYTNLRAKDLARKLG